MQPKSIEEDHADSAKKVQRRLARANKQRQLQTPSPQQWPFCPSAFFGADTQPRIDSVSIDGKCSVLLCWNAVKLSFVACGI